MTQSQMNYIGMITRENPDLPHFVGTTKGEAAVYIEKHKKRNPPKERQAEDE